MDYPPDLSGRAYRIVSNQYPPFDGGGAYKYGSRWVSPGHWVIHGAQSYALAVLENLVHWQTSNVPPTMVYVEVQIPDDIAQDVVEADALPKDAADGYEKTRAIGDAWYARAASAVCWVPSVISPHEYNVLFNQQHPDFRALIVSDSRPVHVDPRLLRSQ